MQDRELHFQNACQNTPFSSLHTNTQKFLEEKAYVYKFSHSQIRNLVTIAIDFQMWNEDIKKEWGDFENRKEVIKHIEKIYENFKNAPKKYLINKEKRDKKYRVVKVKKDSFGFGSCPVASPKTRCCNLLTLDVFEGCAYECSYCSIQSFYDEIKIDENFKEKLLNLKLDKDKIYHIGTGQSSDSLLFGDSFEALSSILEFAKKNQNVILELKSKSNNINTLLNSDVPKNVICTFSLNPEIVVQNEEIFSASLDKRIQAASALRDKGILVGFHFHPMIVFDRYLDEYKKIAHLLLGEFNHDEVAMISFGTLTFIKSVLKNIRTTLKSSKILQMPLVETAGKFSYPLSLKKEMFKTLYDEFKPWHKKIFFYLCMEDESLWSEVFGYEYKDNDEFEEAMKKAYMYKIKEANEI
ncbi:MAG: hypothetical protein LBG67_03040 [Campylobacteraceae bacterium]|jgi:spore photoproduct lyase|nr:hypothetical protein [Campylobacteraceae bacterium]